MPTLHLFSFCHLKNYVAIATPTRKVTRLCALQATAETAYVDADGRRKLKATPVQISLLVLANFGGIAAIALIARAVKGM